MAPQPRKDNTGQRVQDKESKRSQGRLSCAECRLKLKCDKTVPCSRDPSRYAHPFPAANEEGCSAICPNGSLITGPRNQVHPFVLADTEKLHQKIAHMSDRIRQLEDALMILQSSPSIELHAAIQESENNAAQVEEVDESQYIDAFGTLAIRDDGACYFLRTSLLIESSASPETHHSTTTWISDLAPPVTHLSTSFPFSTVPAGISLDYLVENHIPEWNEGYRLCSLYLETAPWFFGAVHQRQLFEELIPLWYQDGTRRPTSSSPPSASSAVVTKGGAHDLALLFIIFCFGALTDMNLPPAPDNPVCEQLRLSIEPLLERPPSVATVQTLSLMAIYEGLKSGENSIESTWTLMGISTKLAQSVHRDCARWKLPPAEVQKRRALFWELFITDGWQSLATGRLATFSLPFVDCELPLDPDQTMAADGTIQPSCERGLERSYSIILDLDRKVRDMELPKYAQGPPPEGLGLSETMSHFMPTNYRELTLLYIHRCFFVHAINSNPNDPIKSQYAPSFLAGYRSACDLLTSVKEQFTRFPAQIARFWVLWTHAFSSTVRMLACGWVMISSVVIHGPTCKVAPAALLELKAACDLFDTAARYGGRAVKFLPIVKRLQGKAQKIYFDMRNGIAPTIGKDIFRPSTENDDDDEMHIFSGKTRTLTTKYPSRPTPPARTAQPDSRAPSDSPPQTNNPSFSGVHPSLVHELNGFDGHIRAQIESAYQQGNEVFAQALLGETQPYQAEQQRYLAEEAQLRQAQLHQHNNTTAAQPPPAVQQQQQQPMQPPPPAVQHQPPQTYYPPPPVPPPSQQQYAQPTSPEQYQQHSLRRSRSMHYEHPREVEAQLDPMAQSQYATAEAHQTYQTATDYAQQHTAPVPAPAPAPAPVQPRHTLTHSQSHSNLNTLRHSQSHSSLHQLSYQEYQQLAPPAPAPRVYQPPQEPPPPLHRNSNTGKTCTNTRTKLCTITTNNNSNTVAPESISPSTSYSQQQYPSPETASTSAAQHQYWTDQAMDTTADYSQQPSHYGMHQYHPQQHYTPEGAMRGIAADDQSLQQTWQSYMYNVGSPRHLLED
ncbi:hypothetical protein EDD18DRAFT_1308308 [Armillaria luteobubalina]|uniref:Xylanolytic transcriptional activator regulatory domain-containing protein n=1 Tax=Armillaria luteobubalina TaxID=153913 RepID=A0AA39QB32_9AGAR|nr:hypothetical protein EDD18DRAFT_1308308 [Armillaria luteobubalina]